MKKLWMLGLLGLVGCSPVNRYDDPKKPIEGVLKEVRFCMGGDDNNCRVDFTDGRVLCFDNGEGFLFHKGKVNRIYRSDTGRTIDAVEIVDDAPALPR